MRTTPRLMYSVVLVFLVSAPVKAADEIAITEIAHLVVGGTGSTYIEVANVGTTPISVNGWRLCSLIDYDSPSWGTAMNTAHGLMQPGDVVVISIKNNDVAGIQAAVGASNYVQFNWSGFTDAAVEDHYDASDLALYVSSPFFTATNMRDFIKWNTTGTVGRTSIAVPPSNNFWPATTDMIPAPLSTDITSAAASNSIQLELCETAPGSGIISHASSSDYFVVNSASHTLGFLPMKGDFDLDGAADTDDIEDFVDVLLGDNLDPIAQKQADVNCDGTADANDIQSFVDALLA